MFLDTLQVVLLADEEESAVDRLVLEKRAAGRSLADNFVTEKLD